MAKNVVVSLILLSVKYDTCTNICVHVCSMLLVQRTYTITRFVQE